MLKSCKRTTKKKSDLFLPFFIIKLNFQTPLQKSQTGLKTGFVEGEKYVEGNKITVFMEGEKINILNPQYMDINFSLGTLKQPLSSWFSFLFKHIKRIVKLKHTTHEHFLTLLHLHRTELVHDGEYQPLLLSSDRYPSNSAQPA